MISAINSNLGEFIARHSTGFILLNIMIFVLLLALLGKMQAKHISFNRRVFSGLALGILFGLLLQCCYGANNTVVPKTIEYMDIIGVGYVRLLQMIVIPLIMVSIISAIITLQGKASLGKISFLTIGILLFTTMIAAVIGITVANVFHLTAEGLTVGAAELKRGEDLQNSLTHIESMSFAKMLIEFIPTNPFLDMTGARRTSTIATVIFSVFIGIAANGVARKKMEVFSSFSTFIRVAHTIVMRIVTLVLRLTPFGVLALMAKVVSGSDYKNILNLLNFVLASYCAIIAMFLVHLLLVSMVGLKPWRFLKKISPLLLFAFTARTSAGSIPLNIKTQTQSLGIPESIANFAASFGATIGQNGCAGIYPAMLVVMIASTQGVDPTSLSFILSTVLIITVSSLGVAGVGGGATFAALIVLSTLNYPVALAGLLISIEPLIDMGRTALNVSDSVTAGAMTSRLLGQTDMAVFDGEDEVGFNDDTHE